MSDAPSEAVGGEQDVTRRGELADAAPLRELLEQSGLSARQFADEILAARGERSLRRWLAEGAPPDLIAWAERVRSLEVRPVRGRDPDLVDVHLVIRTRIRRPGRPPNTPNAV